MDKNIPEIKMLLTDCDGCLTDGGMYYSENGDELKKFNTKDGAGLGMLKARGIIIGVVTGELRELNRRRAKKLGLDVLKEGIKNKLPVVEEICANYGISLENVCYIGDDLPDLPVIEAVGFGCAPSDAVKAVKEKADYVTSLCGGQGAVREVCDIILERTEGER